MGTKPNEGSTTIIPNQGSISVAEQSTTSQLEKELALIKSGCPQDHILNQNHETINQKSIPHKAIVKMMKKGKKELELV